jgi:rhamnulokinase
MAKRIQDYCVHTGQARPQEHGEILLAAYEGLALLYGNVYGTLEALSGRSLETLRIVGGGCQNHLLNQLAANATGRKVITGPIEATAIGNLLVQMMAMGNIQSLDEGRAIVRDSFAAETHEYAPRDSGVWKHALGEWRDICKKNV